MPTPQQFRQQRIAKALKKRGKAGKARSIVKGVADKQSARSARMKKRGKIGAPTQAPKAVKKKKGIGSTITSAVKKMAKSI